MLFRSLRLEGALEHIVLGFDRRHRILDGFAERMRAAGARRTPLAALSRAISGACGHTLIVNLPGSPEGAVTSLQAVLDLIPHALVLLTGADAHTETPGAPRT